MRNYSDAQDPDATMVVDSPDVCEGERHGDRGWHTDLTMLDDIAMPLQAQTPKLKQNNPKRRFVTVLGC
jgi:hypothetical protein